MNIRFFLACFFLSSSCSGFLIVIDPVYSTRTVTKDYEHAITLRYAQTLRARAKKTDLLDIEITRSGRQHLHSIEIANFSNSLQPDVHLCLHCYASEQPELYIYYQQREVHPSDIKKTTGLYLMPASLSYREHFLQSKEYAHILFTFLQNNYAQMLYLHAPLGCPYKHLYGITAPAIALECGISSETSDAFIDTIFALCQSLIPHDNEIES